MTPHLQPPEAFCVCVCNNSDWWLQDYGNDAGIARLYWTIDPTEAHRFTCHRAAIALAQIVKHAHPEVTVRVMEAPRKEASHDSNPS